MVLKDQRIRGMVRPWGLHSHTWIHCPYKSAPQTSIVKQQQKQQSGTVAAHESDHSPVLDVPLSGPAPRKTQMSFRTLTVAYILWPSLGEQTRGWKISCSSFFFLGHSASSTESLSCHVRILKETPPWKQSKPSPGTDSASTLPFDLPVSNAVINYPVQNKPRRSLTDKWAKKA